MNSVIKLFYGLKVPRSPRAEPTSCAIFLERKGKYPKSCLSLSLLFPRARNQNKSTLRKHTYAYLTNLKKKKKEGRR